MDGIAMSSLELLGIARVGQTRVYGLEAGSHLCESGRALARPALWACVVCSNEEDSLVTLDRATEFGRWIDFHLLATSNSSINQHAYFLPHIILKFEI